ncbi:uncharacterized protein LOC102809479 [Saccoglossus kowalevskii]|uniref:Uncharacterized protein LOC102809479 n=1 Tax=Saccoglossus kowalevskii TaxID=10224 RepID=A0ABM0M494_SACKO|nr:PREDICTED: uncharacterized protein LOC102809479 [Saccoglossus kowalevskii]
MHIEAGHVNDISNWNTLHCTLQGIKRHHSVPTRQRLPVTIGILRKLKNALRASHSLHPIDQLMMWSAFTIAFFGFLRVSEFTASSPTYYDTATTLLHADIHIDDNLCGLNVRIKASKTDPFRQGQIIVIAASDSSVCAVRAYHRYSANTSHLRQSPAFQFTIGDYLTRQKLTHVLQIHLVQGGVPNITQFTSHSFRSGAATTAAAAGIPDWLIKCLGRWKSDAYQTYIKTPIQ